MQEKTAKGLSIGIIMDGNGRWAKKRGLPRTAGHKRGADVFDAITRYARDSEVKAISYYAFSTENWSRPKEELETIMDLFGACLERLYKYKKENNKVVFLGDRQPLRPKLQEMMNEIEKDTQNNDGMILNIAINYGSHEEIVVATKALAKKVQDKEISVDDITPELLEKNLYTKGQPLPDLIIRTSGEQRLSNFLLWQSAYSELIFTDVFWPDFTKKEFDAAIAEFHGRERRFGKI